MEIPTRLVEEIAEGNGAVFVGAGLSIGAGLPGWGDLMRTLAVDMNDYPENAPYPDIAQYYVNKYGRQALIWHLRKALDTFNLEPTSAHKALVALETILKLKVAAKSCCYGDMASARRKRRYQSRAHAN